MDLAALVIAVLALLFTIGSFWWIHAREGKLEVAQPHAYAFASKPRLRMPLAFYNTGAKALVVANLRLRVEGDPDRSQLEWITTRAVLRPETDDGFAYATPFAVEGRSTKEVFAEFGDGLGWSPAPGSYRRLRLDAVIHPSQEWAEVASFDWWAPPPGAVVTAYITHRNEPSEASTQTF